MRPNELMDNKVFTKTSPETPKKNVLQKSRFPFVVITLRALEASKALRVNYK